MKFSWDASRRQAQASLIAQHQAKLKASGWNKERGWQPRPFADSDNADVDKLRIFAPQSQGMTTYEKFIWIKEQGSSVQTPLTDLDALISFTAQINAQMAPGTVVTYLEHIRDISQETEPLDPPARRELFRLLKAANAQAAQLRNDPQSGMTLSKAGSLIEQVGLIDEAAAEALWLIVAVGLRPFDVSWVQQRHIEIRGDTVYVTVTLSKNVGSAGEKQLRESQSSVGATIPFPRSMARHLERLNPLDKPYAKITPPLLNRFLAEAAAILKEPAPTCSSLRRSAHETIVRSEQTVAARARPPETHKKWARHVEDTTYGLVASGILWRCEYHELFSIARYFAVAK